MKKIVLGMALVTAISFSAVPAGLSGNSSAETMISVQKPKPPKPKKAPKPPKVKKPPKPKEPKAVREPRSPKPPPRPPWAR